MSAQLSPIPAHASAPYVDLGSVGVRFLLPAEATGGACSVVEHPVPPRTLAAPLHRHSREDEYSFVLEGTLTVQLGDAVHIARPATWSGSRGGSGTPSGTPPTDPAACSN